MDAKYDLVELRTQALLQLQVGVSVAVPPREMLALLADLERYRSTLKRIVAWDYPCGDQYCEAGEVALRALNGKD